jgi:MinD superfamily P-loop ATPase
LACPAEAIREVPRSIGVLRIGTSGVIQFVDGSLYVGEAMSPPLIRAVKRAAPEAEYVIVDCPPGTSCPALESVRGCDLLVLVTEPTPFGLHDLQLAVEMARAMGVPFGVVVNRADIGDQAVWDYCEQQQITVMAEFPEDRAVAEAYAQGILVAQQVPRMVACIERLWEALEAGVAS